jgi:hypothetical protein
MTFFGALDNGGETLLKHGGHNPHDFARGGKAKDHKRAAFALLQCWEE